jgi:hypothetical protein
MIDIKNAGFILPAMSADMLYTAEAANGPRFGFVLALGIWR